MRFFPLLILLLIAFGCCAPCYGQGNSLLWKISGNGLKSPSFLYGTMHTKDQRVFRLADSVLSSFEACEAFAMEVILDEEARSNIVYGLYMDSNISLQTLLSPEQYDSVDQYCRRQTGQSIKNFEKLKPVYTAAILSQSMSGNMDSSKNAHPYFLDEYFQHLAFDQRKKIFGLETIDEQMQVFDLLSYEHQAKLLMETIRKSSDEVNEYERMIRHYLNNDLVKMMAFENDFSLPDSLYDALITQRNHQMSERIDTMIRNRSVFIAVGAGHLGETEGLVNLLRDKGYVVLPVIPAYNNYMDGGWYRKHCVSKKFTVEFPVVPRVSIEKSRLGNLLHYAGTKAASNFELQDYDLYVGEGRQDSMLHHILWHHYQAPVFPGNITPDATHDNRYSFNLEAPGNLNCYGVCFEKAGQVYVLLYSYKRKVNKEARNRFFSSFQLWD